MAQQILEILLDQIDCRQQPRVKFDAEPLTGLAQTIKECGVRQPIRVRKVGNRYEIIVGERRYRACKLAGQTTIPAIVDDRELTEAEITQHQMIENLQREDLSPLEMAAGIHQLMEQSGCNATKAADKLGISAATVSRHLPLLSLSEEIRAYVESGKIPASSAYELTQLDDPAERTAFAQRIASGQLTRDGLSGVLKARKRKGGASSLSNKSSTRITAPLGGNRSITLVGHGLASVNDLIDWITELLDRARKAKTQGLEISTFVRLLKDTAKRAVEVRA
jgi:ParB family chromosome partitioning protein